MAIELVSGPRRLRFGSPGDPELWISARARPPFGVDAFVIEEDTYLVSSAPNELPTVIEPAIRVMTAALDVEPCSVGSVVVRRGTPHRLLAIVHDFDAEPSCDSNAARRALSSVLVASASLGARSLALPLLGMAPRVLSLEASSVLVAEALEAGAAEHLHRVWLVVSEEHQRTASGWFHARHGRKEQAREPEA